MRRHLQLCHRVCETHSKANTLQHHHCFSDVTGIELDLAVYGYGIKESAGPCKELAKSGRTGYSKIPSELENNYANKQPELEGPCDFTDGR